MTAKISAVLLAAGRGTRLKNSTPKVYLSLCKKPILNYSLECLARCDAIAEIIVVIHPDDIHLFQKAAPQLAKPMKAVYGGAQRQDSALAGVRAATGEHVLVHDAARPLASLELIERVIEAMISHGAAAPVLPSSDSLKRVSEGFIAAEVNRAEFVQVQTPQGFRRELLLASLDRARRENRYFSDDAGAVLTMSGMRVKTVEGDPLNIKITTTADLKLAELLVQHRVVR